MITPSIVPVVLDSPESFTTALSQETDGIILIGSALTPLLTATPLQALFAAYPNALATITAHFAADASAAKQSSAQLIVVPGLPANRLVLAPVVSILGDTDDVRRYNDAARAAIARACSAGIRCPTILLFDNPITASAGSPFAARVAVDYSMYLKVTLLGILYEIYQPLQTREHLAQKTTASSAALSVAYFAAVGTPLPELKQAIQWALATDHGRCIARDIGGSDPERMAPLRCAQYIENAFKGVENIKVTVVRDVDLIKKEYPLLHAVTRCALAVPSHFPAVVRLEYHSPDPSKVKENLFLIGKGVTYDTGGADIKHDGAMRGMSHDKCGASACAGFMKTVSLFKPTGVNVIATLGFVRNSVGAASYVSDEILVSRAGVRVLVGNTDAEGRMVMADLLAEAKENALSDRYAAIPSRLLTVATLTGHAYMATGEGYTLSLDNGPAREGAVSDRLFKAGHASGDPFERSSLRREDFKFIVPTSSTEDVVQANSLPSTRTARGHQYPAAFLSVASGIVEHGLDSLHPISYTHVDIAGSAEESLGGLSLSRATGAPVSALTTAFL
ncbi:hypothetical protein MT418_003778 [Batrachochytrium dendrobatidis]